MGDAVTTVEHPDSAQALAYRQLHALMQRVPHLAQPAKVLAIPDWFDDQMAMQMLKHAGHNGTASETLSALKALPFLHHHEGGWAYTESARDYFLDQLLNGNGTGSEEFKDLNHMLAVSLATRRERNLCSNSDQLGDPRQRPDSYLNRELEMRLLGHLLPRQDKLAIQQMLEFYRRADTKGMNADQRAVEAICHRQRRWVKQKLELAYFEGRYNYSRGEERQAEPYLWYVYDSWQEAASDSATDSVNEELTNATNICKELAAASAHFLGIIVWTKYQIADLELAKYMLVESKRLNQELKLLRHEGEVRHTLGRLYLKWGQIKEAGQELERAKAIFLDLEDKGSEDRVNGTLDRLQKWRNNAQSSDEIRSIWGALTARVIGRYPADALIVNDEYLLQIRLRRSVVGESDTFDVTINGINALLNGPWCQQVELAPDQYAVPIIVPFRPLEAGSSQIELDLYHHRRWLQKLCLGFEAINPP